MMAHFTLTFTDIPSRLSEEDSTHRTITAWLRGCPSAVSSGSLNVTQLVNYRYRTLQKRYLNQDAQRGYQGLVRRLSVVILEYPPITRKFAHKPAGRQFLLRMTSQVLTMILSQDAHIQKLLGWLEQCTEDVSLREALFLASLEEYCCQLHQGQPLIIHRLRQYLAQSSLELLWL